MPRGGKREGAGRPCANTVPVKVRLTERQKAIFQSLGGSKWLQQQLNVEDSKMTKFETLSRGAQNIINELFGDGPLTRGEAIAALEDGEFLASLHTTETYVSEAYEYLETIPVNRETELSLYVVRGAVSAADPFDYRDEALEGRLLDCYEDSFDLGIFAADADAHTAAEMRQALDDAKAEKILASELENAALENGPAYCAHLFKYAGNGLEPVEL